MLCKRRIRFDLKNIFLAILLSLTSIGITGASSANAAPFCNRIPFDPTNFSNPTTIDNKYLPLVPGTKLILEGTKPHRVIFIVTDLTKVINGVRTVVVFDRDIQNEHIVESELAFLPRTTMGMSETSESTQKSSKMGSLSGPQVLGSPVWPVQNGVSICT